MMYLGNAFSLNMLNMVGGEDVTLRVRRATVDEVREMLRNGGFISCVGHESTARVLSTILGIEVPLNRIQVNLRHGDVVVVFQLKARLPEGVVLTDEEVMNLPYDFYVVSVE